MPARSIRRAAKANLHRAAKATVETLEDRRLLAYTGGTFDLPLRYDFSIEKNGVEDVDGQNTGFPIVQGNADGNELDSALIDLDTDDGVLRLTSSGDATDGSNFGDDNSLVNGLQMAFDGSDTWLVHTRVTGASGGLTDFAEASEQAGLLVGPSQDRYVKLVFGHNGTRNVVQFVAETTDGSGNVTFPLGTDGEVDDVAAVDGVDLDSAAYVDLWLSGNAETGEITAQYRVEGGRTVRMDTVYDAPDAYFRESGTRAGILAVHKNAGDGITAEFDLFEVTQDELPGTQPAVREVRPGDDAGDINRNAFVAVDLYLPNASVRGSTLSDENVKLVRTSDGKEVSARINTTGGGDSIILTPDRALDADTEYRFEITDGVTDLLGVPFEPFTSTFRTGFVLGDDNAASLGNVAFEQVELPDTVGIVWTGVTVGPDDRLYATAANGLIYRYDLNDDGTLGDETIIETINDDEGEERLVTGMVFAPDADEDDLVAYVTHTQLNPLSTDIPDDLGDDFTGAVTRLSGDDLESATKLVQGLPRSTRDHLTNQPAFGPDGRLYLVQGANSAMGAPDAAWGFRPERLLSGAVLAIDVDAIEDDGEVVDAKTADGGDYDPFADGAPVTVYAGGLRNGYDLVFHSNGHLYVPANGSAAGGNAPAGPDGDPPALNNVSNTQSDYLFDVEEDGYYGHPNPSRGDYVLSGGNPTSGVDIAEVPDYPVGTFPEDDYAGFAYDFGLNQSPDGAVEYTGDAFGGALDGKLVVTRFSGGDDLIVLDFDDDGQVVDAITGLPGTEGFENPLDVTQGPGGVLYVAQFGDREGEVDVPDPNTRRITLLRPVEAGGEAKVAARRIFADAAAGESAVRPFVIRNTGDETLVVSGYSLGITGDDKDLFEFVDAPSTAVSVPAGGEATFNVRFNAPDDATVGDRYDALVFVRTSDENAPEVGSNIAGIVKRGVDGANEPSLQDIFDAYDLGVTTGDPDPETTVVEADELGGIDVQRFEAYDPNKPVAFEVIASYSPPTTDGESVVSFGFYEAGNTTDSTKLGEIFTAQGLDPVVSAPDKFWTDGQFGLYLRSPVLQDQISSGLSDTRGRRVYSEAAFNTWEPNLAERDKFAAYRLPGRDDAVVVSFEEFQPDSDYNDVVIVMTNVRTIGDGGGRLATTGGVGGTDENLGNLVFHEIDPDERDNREGTQVVRNSRQITLFNTGDETLTIDDIDTPGVFTASAASSTLAPGASTTMTVNFTATSEGSNGGLYTGDIVVNASSGYRLTLPVAGYYMPYSEDDVASGTQKTNEEPSLNEMMASFGFTVDVGTAAERLTGTTEAIGDEVISPFWRAAQADLPVEVYQLAAFHLTSTNDTIYYFDREGSTNESAAAANSTAIFSHDKTSAQTYLPAIQGGTVPAAGSFTPDGEFGWRVVNEYSVDDFNDDNSPGVADDQHLFRFFPVKDKDGNTVEDTWLITMDFTGFNFDYNDNVYLVHNVEPADLASPPVGVTATPEVDGRSIVYFGNPGSAAGATVFRSDDGGSSFDRVATFSDRNYLELEDVEDDTVIRVAGIDSDGNAGPFSEVPIVRA